MMENRRRDACRWLDEHDVAMAFVTKDCNVRYFTGMPYGSVLVLLATGKSVLLPWDAILAESIAEADEIIPYTDFGREIRSAIAGVAERERLSAGSRIELPSDVTHIGFAGFEGALPDFALICRKDGFSSYVERRRMVKDESEIQTLKKACSLTNTLMDEVEAGVSGGELATETDVALFLERVSRERGAEAMGFDTIAAGPGRSYGIHAFPAYTSNSFGDTGMSILDFGINVEGYTSDITMTFVRGRATEAQERMITLVEDAYRAAFSMARKGVETYDIAKTVDDIFSDAGYKMPHSLGHGIGLEVHEAPGFRLAPEQSTILEPGIVFTLEPGLYAAEAGGVRIENDFLITVDGLEVLTTSRLIRLPG